MKVVRCEKGHFYDCDTYADCPHCSSKTGRVYREKNLKQTGMCGDGNAKVKEKGKSIKSFFWSVRKKDKKDTESENEIKECNLHSQLTEYLKPDEAMQALGNFDSSSNAKLTFNEDPAVSVGEAVDTHKLSEDESGNPVEALENTKENDNFNIRNRDSEKANNTVGFFCAFETDESPVVGWLVGIDGLYKGKSFELKAGGNSIGRNADNSIELEKDNRVSREAHTIIVYEPRTRVFYIQPGIGSGLTYVNGEIILHHKTIVTGDIIEIGGGKYYFEPLCSNGFSWDELPEFQPICRDGVHKDNHCS